MNKKLTRKEEEQLCGPRLTKKIDDFIFGVTVEAGIDSNPIDNMDSPEPSYGNLDHQLML